MHASLGALALPLRVVGHQIAKATQPRDAPAIDVLHADGAAHVFGIKNDADAFKPNLSVRTQLEPVETFSCLFHQMPGAFALPSSGVVLHSLWTVYLLALDSFQGIAAIAYTLLSLVKLAILAEHAFRCDLEDVFLLVDHHSPFFLAALVTGTLWVEFVVFDRLLPFITDPRLTSLVGSAEQVDVLLGLHHHPVDPKYHVEGLLLVRS